MSITRIHRKLMADGYKKTSVRDLMFRKDIYELDITDGNGALRYKRTIPFQGQDCHCNVAFVRVNPDEYQAVEVIYSEHFFLWLKE